jgi:hypothetical protein
MNEVTEEVPDRELMSMDLLLSTRLAVVSD